MRLSHGCRMTAPPVSILPTRTAPRPSIKGFVRFISISNRNRNDVKLHSYRDWVCEASRITLLLSDIARDTFPSKLHQPEEKPHPDRSGACAHVAKPP